MIFRSGFDKAALILRFDDITSEARFAGADEQNDWIFQSFRKGDRIKIVRKPKGSYDPFASVFRGRIMETESGSAIKGVYTKSLPDYIFTFIIFFVYYTVCFNSYASAENKTAPLAFMIVGAAIILLLFSSLPHTRKRYGEFIRRVTEGDAAENPAAPAENPPDGGCAAPDGSADVKKDEKKEKFKFRL